MLSAIFYHLGAFFSRMLPRPLPQWIARAIGEANWWLRPATRRDVRANLRTIHGPDMGEAEINARAHRVVLNFARAIQIFLELPFFRPGEIESRTDLSEFRAAVDPLQGKPFVLASAHLGPWELGGYLLGRLGFRVHTVALEHPSEAVTGFYSARRELVGVRAYPVANAFSRLKAAIDAGEVVALLIDRNYGNAGKRFTMFGVESQFPLGHLVLSLRTGVPVLTGALVFDGATGFKYVHGGTHYPGDEANDFDRLEALQERCLRDLERIVRVYSDQWCYFEPLRPTETYGADP